MIFDSNSIRSSFDVVKDKLVILCNHCLNTCYRSSSYSNIDIPNLFVYDAFNKNLQNQSQYSIPKKYILELRSIKNDLFLTIEYDYKLLTHDISIRSIDKPSIAISKLKFDIPFSTAHYTLKKLNNEFEYMYNLKGSSYIIYIVENKIKSFAVKYGNKNQSIQEISDITADYYKVRSLVILLDCC